MSLILEMVDVSRIHGEGHLAVQALTNASLTVAPKLHSVAFAATV